MAETADQSAPDGGNLQRDVSLPLLVLYGLGTTIGAGIYALTGEVAGEAGMRAPVAFTLAAVLAGVTALGFAELAGRLPRAAGEAVFVEHAFARRALTTVVGIAIIVAGLVAGAAITDAFGGYVAELADIPRPAAIVALTALLTVVAVIGVRESVTAAALFTTIEIIGLGVVIWAGRDVAGDLVRRADELLGPPGDLAGWTGITGGAFLAFFAFLGFEDIDSLAEETRDSRRALPRAVVLTLAITTVLYITVSSVAVLVVDPAELGRSDAPLVLVYERAGGNGDVIAVVAALAMVNGALVQLVMIPRVAYGLARLDVLPSWAGTVSARTGTPARATLLGAVIVTAAALLADLGLLARITSAVTMAIFATTNASLLMIKHNDGPTDGFAVPRWLPIVGLVISLGLFVSEAGALLT